MRCSTPGNPLAANDDYFGTDSYILYTAPASGTYYVGVNGYSNTGYDPRTGGSGSSGSTGTYALSLLRLDGGSTTLTGIDGTAASGTPALAGVASANPGQTITLHGSGLLSNDQLIFTTVDSSGRRGTTPVNPASVASDGTSLTVVVPTASYRAGAAGARVGRRVPPGGAARYWPYGPLGGSALHGGDETVGGHGFVEAGTTLHFGAATLTDLGSYYGLDVNDTYVGGYYPNSQTVVRAAGGPADRAGVGDHLGGTSATFGPTLTGTRPARRAARRRRCQGVGQPAAGRSC